MMDHPTEEQTQPAAVRLRGIVKSFGTGDTKVTVLRGIDLDIYLGEMLLLVGESGGGKTTLLSAIAGILEIDAGNIDVLGVPLSDLPAGKRTTFRGKTMGFIYQQFNLLPALTAAENVAVPLLIQHIGRREALHRARTMLERVGLSGAASKKVDQLSGGQRQRIGIARALALKPQLIVADEPVSALDVSIQAQVVNLLDDLQRELGLSYLFIAHDLSVVQHISDRVVVMYLGKVMEVSNTKELFENPKHPYTKALLSAVPIPDPKLERQRERIILQGDLPSPANPPSGCVFNTRCWKVQDKCRTEVPLLRKDASDTEVACHFPLS